MQNFVVVLVADLWYPDSPKQVLECDVLSARWEVMCWGRGEKNLAISSWICLQVKLRRFEEKLESIVGSMVINPREGFH